MRVDLPFVFVLPLAVGCSRSPARPPRDVPRTAPPDAAVVSARDAGGAPPDVGCPAMWSEATALPLPTVRDADDDFELEAYCDGDALGAAWRAEGLIGVAERRLRPDATWAARAEVTREAAALGVPLAAEGKVWIPWSSPAPARTLHVTHLKAAEVRAGGEVRPVPGGRFVGARVLGVYGRHALIAATWRRYDVTRAVVLGVSAEAGMPSTGAVIAEGALVAALPGRHALTLTATRVPRAEGGPWFLAAHRIELAALALTALSRAVSFTARAVTDAPDGGAGQSLALGRGPFEFTQPASHESGATLVQTVVGAERGAARVAWFPREGEASVTLLPLAPSGLGAVFDAPTGAMLAYWDERHAPSRAAVTRQGLGAVRTVGDALESDFAVRRVARMTRWITCGGALWRVYVMMRGDGTPGLHATRECL
jgi:hypothetical protein